MAALCFGNDVMTSSSWARHFECDPLTACPGASKRTFQSHRYVACPALPLG